MDDIMTFRKSPSLVVRAYWLTDAQEAGALPSVLHESLAAPTGRAPRPCVAQSSAMPAAWSALHAGRLVGVVSVDHAGPCIASLTGLRVAHGEHESAVIDRLLDTVAEHCRRYGYLKLIVPTDDDADRAAQLLGRAGLRYAGRRSRHDHPALEFYVDLYRRMPLTGADLEPVSAAFASYRTRANPPDETNDPARFMPLRITSASITPANPLPPSH